MKDWVLCLILALVSLACNHSPESAPQLASVKTPVAAKADVQTPAAAPSPARQTQEECIDICEQGMSQNQLQGDCAYECEADPQAYKKGYGECVENCGAVMDDHGQVRDECPKECKEDPQAYTQDDVPSDDESAGLVVTEQCLSDCLGKKVDASAVAKCNQSCCVGHCKAKADYSGSGMADECPMTCRDFLKRSAKK